LYAFAGGTVSVVGQSVQSLGERNSPTPRAELYPHVRATASTAGVEAANGYASDVTA
jgi:hypothetical protein